MRTQIPLWLIKAAAKVVGRQTGVSNELKNEIAERGCIFIHVPKCAGNAVQMGLFGGIVFGHQTIRQYQIALPGSIYRNAWKFAVTRDPFERLASAWRYLKAGGLHSHDAKYFEENIAQFTTFDHFVNDWLIYQNIDNCECLHFKTQLHYLSQFNGVVSMDCIVKLSDLSVEYKKLRQRFGGGELEVYNASGKGPVVFGEFYKSRETYENVATIYAEDIKKLGYGRESELPV